jgi:hypothetical protein
VANLADRHYIIRSFDDPTPRLIDLTAIDLDPGQTRQTPLPTDGFVSLPV